MPNLYFTICSLFVSILMLLVFFVKRNVKNMETSIFRFMLLTSTLDGICMFIIIYTAYTNPENLILMEIFNKIDFTQYIVWSSLLFLYCFYIARPNSKNYKKLLKIICIIDIISVLSIAISPINIHIAGNAMYAYGVATNITYAIAAIYFLSLLVVILSNRKNIINKKYIPVVSLILFGGIVFVVNKLNPTLLIIPAVISYINLIMYFTIENPDVKMLKTVELAKTQAEQANAAKTDFLSSMSHEIRTPLNAIVGFSECIVKADQLDDAKNDAKDIIMASQNLLEIVNGILDISKIESGKMELVNTEYDIVTLGENLTKLMKARMGEKPIEFQCKFGDDLPGLLYGDEGKVKQIITNILTNAVKYTEKGFINFEINCINEGNACKLAISIEDTGRGIKPEKVDSLFNKFERLDEDKNTTLEGTGLGLAITKRLVEMMNGKIIVQSKYGEGTKFTVYLVQQIRAMDRQVVEDTYRDNRIADFTGKKVMVVDDNKLNIKIASRLLSEYNVVIEECESGFDCIDKINAGNNYDLILMDDMMPKLSGVETFKRLQLIEGFHIPVVALTANAIDGMREQYLDEGFSDYLSKPIIKDELNRVLNAYLAMKIVNVDIFEPLPSSIYEITDEDIKEIDELMPKSELEPTTEEKVETSNTEVNASDKVIEQKEEPVVEEVKVEETKKEVNESIETKEVNDSVVVVSVENNSEEVKTEEVVEVKEETVVVVEQKEEPVVEEVKVEIGTNNKGSKEFLISNDIDVDAGLELLGDMEMYDETLRGFLNETTERIPKMEEYKNSNDMKNYAILAHAMKSDSKYLGFKKLAELSLNHELKGKEDDSNYVNENYEELMTEANRIINIVKEYIGV